MERKMSLWGVVLSALVFSGGLFAGQETSSADKVEKAGIKLRVMEGLREGVSQPVGIVTSSYLRYALTATIPSAAELADEQTRIRNVFNLKDVKLLTEADLSLRESPENKAVHVFRLNGKEYTVIVNQTEPGHTPPFLINVLEQDGSHEANLLDSGFNLPDKKDNIVIFGFEDTQGKPYFLSLRFTSLWAKSISAENNTLEARKKGGVAEVSGKQTGLDTNIGRTTSTPPKLIKMIEPIYPNEARKRRIEGVVILEAATDIYGRVRDAKVLKSIPGLDRAAVDAVKQWVYKPVLADGKPTDMSFTVTVKFALDKTAGRKSADVGGVIGGVVYSEEKDKKIKEFEKDAVPCQGDIKPPKLIKKVNPFYPEEAREKGVEGLVILSAKIDESGNVIDVMVLRSIPELDQAAIDAVKQWAYEPVLLDGKTKKVIFTVTVRFQLK